MSKIIGKNVVRVDGYEKITGKALYGDDMNFPGMLYAVQRYTDIPSGKILDIDISEAEKIKGVKKIILHKNVLGNAKIGPIRQDQYVLVEDEVFYSGDVIATIAATSKEIAALAADKIKVKYQEIQALVDLKEAAKEDARLIHPEYKTNVAVHYPLKKGNVEKGFAESDHVIEREFQTGFQEHAYIETEVIIAVPDATCKGIKIYGSIQNPFTTRKIVAKFMKMNLNQVNVFCSNLGGSFGGKDDTINAVACRCALLAYYTDLPVKISLNREDSMKESYKRHPYIMNYKVGFTKDGKLKAMKINILADSGAYSSQSFFVTWRSVVQATGPYEVENVETEVKAIYTNNTYTAAFRGFGSPQIIYAQESLMDEIAQICSVSPYEIRKINGYKQGSITASGQKLESHTVSLSEVMEKAVDKSAYQKKVKEYAEKNKSSKRFKFGIGLACSFRGCALGAEGTDATSAIVSVQADGSAYVFTGLNENGQGLRTTFSQITAEVLGLPYDKVHFLEPQTAAITDGGPTVASRGTIMGGNAVIIAAKEVKNRIFEAIKNDLQIEKIEDTTWENGEILAKSEKKILFEEACNKAYFAGVNLSAYGWYKAPNVSWQEETGQGNAYFTYVYACQLADIIVDSYTGKIEVNKITAAHDMGKAINKLGVEGQIYGGVTQGYGYGVLEHYNIQNGKVKSENLDEYLIPTIKDIKDIEAIIVENPDVDGPLGAKSLGEPTLELGSAALNNAVSFALGKRFYEIPLTLEKVFLGKQLVKPSRASEKESAEKKQLFRVSNVSVTTPKNLKEALNFLNQEKFKILAGGTDVVISLRKELKKTNLLNIDLLPELKGIEIFDSKIEIGSNVKISTLVNNKDIQKHFPMLIKAISLIGSLQIRNRACLAGNIANASLSADSVPPLIAYKAKVLLESVDNKRELAISDFIIKGYQTQLKDNEIITKIIIPIEKKNFKYSYFQLGRRGAVNITRLSIAVLLELQGNSKVKEIRIVPGALFNKFERFSEIENYLKDKELNEEIIEKTTEILSEKIEKEIGGRWSSEYKKPVFLNLFKNSLNELLN